jgi:hypothetical protein
MWLAHSEPVLTTLLLALGLLWKWLFEMRLPCEIKLVCYSPRVNFYSVRKKIYLVFICL